MNAASVRLTKLSSENNTKTSSLHWHVFDAWCKDTDLFIIMYNKVQVRHNKKDCFVWFCVCVRACSLLRHFRKRENDTKSQAEVGILVFSNPWPFIELNRYGNEINKCTSMYKSILYYKRSSLMHVSATLVTIHREAHYKWWICRDTMKVYEQKYRYKRLSFETMYFKIHISL